MRKIGLAGLVITCTLTIGCGDDGGSTGSDAAVSVDAQVDAPSGPGAFSVMGTVGTGAPATGLTVVVWVVSSGSPDYIYKFGEGSSTGAQFIVSMSTVPPAAAINSYGIAVGLVAVLAAGTAIPADGMIDEMVLDGAGYTPDHAIIYKAPDANPSTPWMMAFPVGYSCGQCVPATGGGFDTFVVTTCSTVEVDMTPTSGCNWT
jgi:hypothetical protein